MNYAKIVDTMLTFVLLVTTRPVAHSGGCGCTRNCVGQFGMGTGQTIFDIRRTVLVPGVCPYIRISVMLHHVHTGEAMVTRKKIAIFCLSP